MNPQLGIMTWGDITSVLSTGQRPSPSERLTHALEMAGTAESAGLDMVGTGEGHGPHRVKQDPSLLLSALGQVIGRIRLAAAASALTTADPARSAEQLSLLSLLSNGRVDLVAGRGALPRNPDILPPHRTWRKKFSRGPLTSFLDLLRPGSSDLLGTSSTTHWTSNNPLPGGTHDILRGRRRRARCHARRHGWRMERVSLAVPALVVPDDAAADPRRAAAELAHPYFSAGTRPHGAVSPEDPTWTLDEFAAHCAPTGSLVVGGVSEVVEKPAMLQHELGSERILLRVDINGLPHDTAIRPIRLLGEQGPPQLREKHLHGVDPPHLHG